MKTPKLKKIKDLLDDNRDIGFGYKVKDLYDMNYEEVIKFFKDRIDYFYIKPSKFIIKKIKRRKKYASIFGFILIAFSSILIDTLSQYRYGEITSKETIFTQFLRDYIKKFKSTFTKIGKLYLKDDMKNSIKGSQTNYADVFYKGFRCGIVHNGKILSYGGYVYNQNSFFKENQWTDSNKTKRLELAIDPVILFKRVEDAFKKYIKELQTNLYMTEFLEKFEFDFGFSL